MTIDKKLALNVANAIASDVCTQLDELIDILAGDDDGLSDHARTLLSFAESMQHEIAKAEQCATVHT